MKKMLLLILVFALPVFAAGLDDLAKKAATGDAQAQYDYAMALMMGDYADPDLAEAVKWFEKAAYQGHPEAQYELGTAIFNGDGVKADKIMGCAWLYLSTVDSSEYICLSQINADERAQAKAASEKLAKTIK